MNMNKHYNQQSIENLPIGTRVTIHDTTYNNNQPFTGTVQFSTKISESKTKVINPDVFIDHGRYRSNKQHQICEDEYATIINHLPNDLFEV